MITKLLGMLLGRAGSSTQGRLLSALMPMLAGGGRGGGLDLSSILDGLRRGGLDSQVDSWIGSGQNQALSSRQVRRNVPQADLDRLAQSAGVSRRQAADGLAKLLPSVVDKLSPEGRVDDAQHIEGGLDGLRAALGV